MCERCGVDHSKSTTVSYVFNTNPDTVEVWAINDDDKGQELIYKFTDPNIVSRISGFVFNTLKFGDMFAELEELQKARDKAGEN